jgi:CBS domain-containing protein
MLAEKGHNVLTTNPDTSVYEAIGQMVDANVGSILVIEDDKVRGIFTERDYLRRIALEGRTSKTTRIDEVMTTPVICVEPSYEVKQCLEIMTENRCRHLPVMNENELVGIISIGDCVKQLSDSAQKQVKDLKNYIVGKYPG